jgi:hypothetical protein
MPSEWPGIAGVVGELVALNPDRGLREQVDATHVVPMGMADDHVGHLFRRDARKSQGIIRTQVVFDRPQLEPARSVKAAVEQDDAVRATNEPERVN